MKYFTYKYINNHTAIIVVADKNELEENLFDSVKEIEKLLDSEFCDYSISFKARVQTLIDSFLYFT